MTTRLLFALITIMMYLPVTVVSAMPDTSFSGNMQTTPTMAMDNHHEHQTTHNKCGHCSEQHNCKTAHNSCTTIIGIPSQSFNLDISHYAQPQYTTFHVNTIAQQSIPLLRPPISL